MLLKPRKERDNKDREKEKDRSHRRKAGRPHRKTSSSSSPEQAAQPSTSSLAKRRKDPLVEAKVPRSSSVDYSPSASKTSLPYPKFSKAHSKECVAKDVKADLFTPSPTDLAAGDFDTESIKPENGLKRGKSPKESKPSAGAVPPSPPLTSLSVEKGKEVPLQEADRPYGEARDAECRQTFGSGRPNGSTLDGTPRASPKSFSEVPLANGRNRTSSPIPRTGRPLATTPFATLMTEGINGSSVTSGEREAGLSRRTEVESITESDATSATEVLKDTDKTSHPTLARRSGPASSARSNERLTGHRLVGNVDPIRDIKLGSLLYDASSEAQKTPLPPPPPPPPTVPAQIPRVDYLLQNGGLPYNVPRTLLVARETQPGSSPQLAREKSMTSAEPVLSEAVEKVFAPYHDILRQYETVMSKNGSVAVATGYRSVARRLLDRLEAVFARDISSEYCECLMCERRSCLDEDEGLGWGDVLEWVSGRKTVPAWPIFDFGRLGESDYKATISTSLDKAIHSSLTGGTDATRNAPIDADVPTEFRDHYKKQTKKAKEAVDRWLVSQVVNPTSPAQVTDDETLTFAIITHLEQDERDDYTQLLGASSHSDEDSRCPTPAKVRSELLLRTGKALQRLYRLAVPPRDPESAAFLVRHPTLHRVLATLAAVTPSEWDVLTSGRFDGFLWSGADDRCTSSSPQPPRGSASWTRGAAPSSPFSISQDVMPLSAGEASRTQTPFNVLAAAASRGGTPAVAPPPVSIDEETEIAVLAEVEREIYLSMEALEDAFEVLHQKAENVRQAMRERGAGLSMAGQSRRNALNTGGEANVFEIGRGTPGVGYSPEFIDGGGISDADKNGGSYNVTQTSQWGWGGGIRDTDCGSDVWPDDSASNISSNRIRRPKRRNERRTPALVEEAEDDFADENGI